MTLSADNVQRECYPGEWPCPSSGLCIPIDQLCDGTPHCPDGGDETNATAGHDCSEYQQNWCQAHIGACSSLSCSLMCSVHRSGIWRCASLSCEHRCHASPYGGTCTCPLGYIVSSNNSRTCIGVCTQYCETQKENIDFDSWLE